MSLPDADFRAENYGSAISVILNPRGGGHRMLPLVHESAADPGAGEAIARLAAPSPVQSGLYLYCGLWGDAHRAADAGESPENYYWHAIVHRQEPDYGNSAYWFRRTGVHRIFPHLRRCAAGLGYASGNSWDPFAFIDICRTAAGGSRCDAAARDVALGVQLIEWQLLFDHCARGRTF